MIAKLLFRFARTRPLGAAVRFGFAHLSGLLPVRRVCETGQVIAFHHPRPAWERHVLFVPKEPIRSLRRVRPEQVPLVRRLVELALAYASREQFDRDGFALLVNGGAYQDVAQLHFHLASRAREAWYECPDRPAGAALLEAGAGRYDARTRIVTIAEAVIDEDPRILAVELAHELQHALDWKRVTLNLLDPDCVALETRGFEAQVRVTRLFSPDELPGGTALERHVALVVRDYEQDRAAGIATRIAGDAVYRHACSEGPA